MFTKEDYKQYFSQISVVERSMIYASHRLLSKVKDKSISDAVGGVLNDEMRHYAQVLMILRNYFIGDIVEKRRYERDTAIGDVFMTRPDNGEENKARCVDMSSGGLGFESDIPIEAGARVRALISFYSEKEPFEKNGEILWLSEVNINLFYGKTLHLYLGGMRFE